MRLKNRLWNPEHEEKKKPCKKTNSHQLDDLICQQCLNKEIILPNGDKLPCQHTCYPLTWVDGNVGLKETLLDKQFEPSSDYNAVLSEGITSRRIDYTASINDKLKIKCVAILLEADFSIKDIAKLLRCSSRQIYRMRLK